MSCKISIITATYNSEQTLSDALQSVDSQTYANVEHIIIDGASGDNTLSLLNGFNRITKVVSEPDRGIYDAMNKGIKLADGEVIGILNSDDIYAHSEVLEKVAAIFEDETVQAVYADLLYVQERNLQKVVRYWKSGKYSPQYFYYGWMPPHPTFFVKRDVYEHFGLFNTNFRSAADYELMLRFLLKHEIEVRYLPEVTVRMRTGGVSNSSLKNRWRANREDRRAWEINGLTPYFFTIPLKPFRKISQFFIKY